MQILRYQKCMPKKCPDGSIRFEISPAEKFYDDIKRNLNILHANGSQTKYIKSYDARQRPIIIEMRGDFKWEI